MGLDARIEIHGNVTQPIVDEINERLNESSVYDNMFILQNGIASLSTMWRYWGPGYERGPWKEISFVLMTCLAMELDVHYGSDHDDDITVMTPERYFEYWTHFASSQWNDYQKTVHEFNNRVY